MICVTVLFETAPADHDRFAARVSRQARDSMSMEQGCRRFDVWASPERPGQFHLYEIYDDRTAFDAHLASSHYAGFDRDVAAMVIDKTVTIWESRL